MQRNDKLMMIRDVPAAIVDALDAVMETQGYRRVFVREIEEDWTPLLNEAGGPLVFVLTDPRNDWTGVFSSLAADDEWALAEAVARGLEQPTMYALLSDDTATYGYRYFENGVLHEEYVPGDVDAAPFDGGALLQRLQRHGVPVDLIDDRVLNFGAEHLLVGYSSERGAQAAGETGG